MNTQSMGFIIGVAALLTAGGLFMPQTTSLGQNITEAHVTGWQGEYERDIHAFKLRMETGNPQTTVVVPMNPLPMKDFPIHKGVNWFTPLDTALPMRAAMARDPHLLAQALGTRNNVFTPFTPFPGSPVSYSAGMLKKLAQNHINPEEFGGPDIPAGSVPLSHLTGGVLQIDTLTNANTLKQCEPGQMPPELTMLRHKYG
ncbi:MAG: hypothetical protein M1294_16535 [Firmicutes bacterium]|jgi:hypothetical protein|uniref:Uncharacterized protein n=1 Tax=Sulfobacillus benefaciens TaxID=453960 RepID=A0A2T2X317_9FIRM|nr:hypothetical protein [Bacillota bacterium]MCL5014521.1 hypothetical protein [Bacillota bacterium]PSR28891.1 MAG: hypothetical protein C7B43_09420 [Sulfobacillus benefaciens]